MALTLLPELTEKMTSTAVSVVTVNDLSSSFLKFQPPLSNMIAAAMQNICNQQFDFVFFSSFITLFVNTTVSWISAPCSMEFGFKQKIGS